MEQATELLDNRWIAPLRLQARRIHELMCIMAVIIFPLFAFFDKYTIPAENYWFLTTIRLSIAAIILIWLLIQKRFNTQEIYLTYFAFCAVSWLCCLGCVLGGEKFLYQHNIAYCTVFLAASLFILWPWYHSLFVVLSSIMVYAILTKFYNLFSLKTTFLEGGAVLLTIMILHPVIILFRYESNKREFKLKVALEDSNELLKRSKDISDERNRELLVAREDLNEANTELKAVNQNLESLVTARTQTLEETNLKLHKALHELDRFLYSSYHDIKGPLARMRGLANLLNSAMNSAEQMLEFNQYFSRTISEMETLIDKLNRVNSLNQQNLDLNEISVIDFLEKVKVQYPEALFTFESETTFSFVSDAGLLNQIFDCLLDNSLKYRNSSDLLHISIKANQHLFGTG